MVLVDEELIECEVEARVYLEIRPILHEAQSPPLFPVCGLIHHSYREY